MINLNTHKSSIAAWQFDDSPSLLIGHAYIAETKTACCVFIVKGLIAGKRVWVLEFRSNMAKKLEESITFTSLKKLKATI